SFNQEMIMSQKVPESSNVKNPPVPEQQRQEPPVTDVSPDDPFPIEPPGGGTSKPGQLEKGAPWLMAREARTSGRSGGWSAVGPGQDPDGGHRTRDSGTPPGCRRDRGTSLRTWRPGCDLPGPHGPRPRCTGRRVVRRA